MEWQESRLSGRVLGRYILLCFAVVVLTCAVKNYLAFLLQGSPYCEYLCPSLFKREAFILPGFLQSLFELQNSIPETAQDYLNLRWSDPYKLFSTLLVAPLVEEAIYRGPLLLVRKKFAGGLLFWTAAVVLSVLFTLSHDLNGLLLLPILVMGLCSSWLVARSGRFWPSLVFHVLYNFYFLSITIYQTLFWSD